MNIHFDNCEFQSHSGPNTFATRLAKAFLLKGHMIVDSGNEADISIVFIEPSGKPLAKKIVQRLDGIWFKPSEFEHKNISIKKCYNEAHAVIFQSYFDQKMVNHHWGVRNNTNVIYNGIELIDIEKNPAISEIKEKFGRIIVSSSNWHPQKRLKSNFELFKHLTTNQNAAFIVLGSNPDVRVNSPNVFYAGSQSHETCLQIFEEADMMLHLAWADHCPNVVVEALSRKCPVICSSVGGTVEIIKGRGLTIIEEPYNYELYDYDNPPSLEFHISKYVPKDLYLSKDFEINDLDINIVVDKYIDVLTKVVNE